MRSMVKLIHADGFFPMQDLIGLRDVAKSLNYVQMPHGLEVPNFNLIFPNIEHIFYKVLGERVIVDPERSGILRKPNNFEIHFESFNSSEEWCFIVALEPTTVNLWHHIDPELGMGDFGKADSKHVFEGANFNYNNLFEWKIHTNILLEENQCLFIRPWVFHSLENGLIQYYRLLADNNYRILVMGYPGSKKDSVTQKLSNRFEDVTVLDSLEIRKSSKDVDFTKDGHIRQAYRLLEKCRKSKSKVTIVNMSCPLEKTREILNPDIIVWVSDRTECEYPDVNEMYEIPTHYDVECKDDSDESVENIIKRILSKRL